MNKIDAKNAATALLTAAAIAGIFGGPVRAADPATSTDATTTTDTTTTTKTEKKSGKSSTKKHTGKHACKGKSGCNGGGTK